MSTGGKPRAVFDCMVFFQAAARPTGPAARLFIDCPVTRDNDMLDLMGDAAFRARFPTLTILDPVALLRLLNGVGPAP